MSTPPANLLSRVAWSCGRKRYASAQAFSDAVRQYQIDIFKEDRWAPDVSILNSGTVRVCFRCWNEEGTKQPRHTLLLKSDTEGHFTALDLFFKICDGIAAHLVEHNRFLYDHCFFEGLSRDGSDDPPLYFIYFGS